MTQERSTIHVLIDWDKINVETERVMRHAPRNRNILVKNRVFHYSNRIAGYYEAGSAWCEAWFDGKDFRVWAGNKRTTTTETFAPLDWVELPKEY